MKGNIIFKRHLVVIYTLLSMTMLYVSLVKKKIIICICCVSRLTKSYISFTALNHNIEHGYWVYSLTTVFCSFKRMKRGFVCERAYLSNRILQFVVLRNVKACSLRSLMKEQQILSVPGVLVNIFLCDRTTAERSDGCPPPVAPVYSQGPCEIPLIFQGKVWG